MEWYEIIRGKGYHIKLTRPYDDGAHDVGDGAGGKLYAQRQNKPKQYCFFGELVDEQNEEPTHVTAGFSSLLSTGGLSMMEANMSWNWIKTFILKLGHENHLEFQRG